ncbi:hypothetical protein B0O99DRAFT_247729 [Bisporella sp. PMI_857]|nr:hypothetical protein B0O99DRAFT_247729 [Bisporella sp. PMI_857]
MAEAVGLAASILALATTGAKLASALTKFSISYRGAEQKITEIASRASLTSNILQEIASTLQSHEDVFQKSAFLSTWCDVLGSASGCFERLEAALEKARGPGSKRDGGAWSTLKKWEWALGGEERMAECERGLEKCGQQVLMMQQVIQYKVLQKIVPTERERDEKRELREKLDWIVRRLEETGLVSVPPPTRPTSKGLSPKISSLEGPSSKLMSARILPPAVPLPKDSGVQRQSSTMQSSESLLNVSTVSHVLVAS